MIVIALAGLLVLVAFKAGKFLRKHNVKIYLVLSVIAVASFLLQDVAIFKPITQGFIGLGFFYLVMLAGALKKKSSLSIKLQGVRREFSIMGFIMITPHALMYLLEMLDGVRDFQWFGIAAYILMIPLFITSFVTIRKKMSRNSWINLQRIAYVIYILLFIHLILNASVVQNLVAYLILFIIYFILKIKKIVFEIMIKRKS